MEVKNEYGTYRGKPVESMTRQELIDGMIEMAEAYSSNLKDSYGKSLLNVEATVRTWRFMWRYPFIKIINITGKVNAMQKYIDQQQNLAIDKLFLGTKTPWEPK